MTEETNDWIDSYATDIDVDGYVEFNHDRRLGQNQYASRYARGSVGEPDLGAGLRWKNLDSGNYHSILIHIYDLLTFHERVRRYRKAIIMGVLDPIGHAMEEIEPEEHDD